MTVADSSPIATEWLTIPALVEATGESLGRVKRYLDESNLVGMRRNDIFVVPAVFLVGGHPLPSLRGTIIVLQDAGFSDEEVIEWMLSPEDSMGRSPIEALTAGHKAEVRRVARALA
ncbi:Rv2175c family DNA-binding protein (plasmid) [Coraliomargarita sp. W4R53]